MDYVGIEPGLRDAEDVTPWLPIPASWAPLSVQRQDGDRRSMLELYRSAVRVRRASSALGRGELRWVDGDADPAEVLELDLVGSDETVRVLLNLSDDPVAVSAAGDLLLASEPVVDGLLPGASAAWVRLGS